MTSRAVKAIAAGAVVVVAAAGGYLAFFGGHPEEGYGHATSVIAVPPVTLKGQAVPLGKPLAAGKADAARVDLFLDGWSARILKTAQVTAAVGSGTGDPVEFKAVTAADVGELLKTTPKIVADALSRQVSGSTSVSCAASGCAISGKKVDVVRYITDPSSVPGFGEEYKGWGVRSLLYYAGVPAGDGSAPVTLSAPGYSPVTVAALPLGAANVSVGPDNGYLYNRYLIGTAFKRFFLDEPAWVGKNAARYVADEPAGVPDAGDPPTRSIHDVLGLDHAWPGTENMNASVLTYLSSPTSGCDVGVLCTPDRVKATISNPRHDQQRVCTTIDGKTVEQIAIFDTALISAKFPHPTSQFGLWNGQSIADFGHGVGLLAGGVPPLTFGSHTFRWNSIGLADGDDGDVRVTAGVFGNANGPASTLAATLNAVSLDGHTWTLCGSQPSS